MILAANKIPILNSACRQLAAMLAASYRSFFHVVSSLRGSPLQSRRQYMKGNKCDQLCHKKQDVGVLGVILLEHLVCEHKGGP